MDLPMEGAGPCKRRKSISSPKPANALKASPRRRYVQIYVFMSFFINV